MQNLQKKIHCTLHTNSQWTELADVFVSSGPGSHSWASHSLISIKISSFLSNIHGSSVSYLRHEQADEQWREYCRWDRTWVQLIFGTRLSRVKCRIRIREMLTEMTRCRCGGGERTRKPDENLNLREHPSRLRVLWKRRFRGPLPRSWWGSEPPARRAPCVQWLTGPPLLEPSPLPLPEGLGTVVAFNVWSLWR